MQSWGSFRSKLTVTGLPLLLACASGPEVSTKPPDLRMEDELVTARIVEDTVRLSTTSNGLAIRATAIITNRANRPLFKGGRCEPDAQLQTGQGWESVVSPICVGPAAVQRIEAGYSLTVPVTIYGFTATGMEPQIDRRKASGTFRIVFAVTFEVPMGNSPAYSVLPSSSFVVVDPANDAPRNRARAR